MKKITSILVVLTMLATLFTVVPVSAESDVWGNAEVATAFAGGTGTTSDPYLISNAAELRYTNDVIASGEANDAGTLYYKAAYKLTADIDFGGDQWIPLGYCQELTGDIMKYAHVFSGTFEGDNHVISNVKITRDNTAALSEAMGFFGYSKGKIYNLGLDNVEIEYSNYDYVYDTTNNKDARVRHAGVFVGGAQAATITNCFVTNSKIINTNGSTTESSLAGFVGTLSWGNNVSNCYAYNVTVGAGNNAYQGGFFGKCASTPLKISNCYAAKISLYRATGYATTYGFGAFRNTIKDTNYITNCYSTLNDAVGTASNANTYYPPATDVSAGQSGDWSGGKTGMTVDGLINAMLATDAYAQNDYINDGYPYLKSFEGFDGTAATAYESGDGSIDTPYGIATAAQLLYASEMISSGAHASKHFILLSDIDYNNHEWHPIGTAKLGTDYTTFKGTFNGNNHVIKNLKVTNSSSEIAYRNVGFFGQCNGATIKNLGIENIQISANNSRVNNTTGNKNIEYLGGFIAYAQDTIVENCFVKNSSVLQTNYGQVQAGEVGGFVGMARGSSTSFKNCYSYKVVLKSGWSKTVSGFAGSLYQESGASFENCFAADISRYSTSSRETTYGFGFIGTTTTNSPTTVINCYSTLQGTTGNFNSSGYTSPEYTTAYAFGVEGASMDTIVSQFDDVAAFGTTDTSINGGYPYLSFETPVVEPDYVIEAVSKAATGNYDITVDVARKTGVTGTATVYIASYDIDGRLINAGVADVNADDFSCSADVDAEIAKTIKVFVWNGTQSPLVEAPYVAVSANGTQFNQIWSATVSTDELERTPRLVLMGDSLMDDVWNSSDRDGVRKYGWEAYIGNYLDDDMELIKHGHSGQTVKMFIDGRSTYHVCSWDSIKSEFGMNDYVIIALGTNDNSRINNYNNGKTEDAYSAEQFKAWYKTIISETRSKNAEIIVLTPPPTNYSVKNGKFVNTDSWASTKALLELESEVDNLTVINVGQAYADALNNIIDTTDYTAADLQIKLDADSNITDSGLIFVDSVHFTEYGADLLASVIAEQIALRTTGLEEFITLQ